MPARPTPERRTRARPMQGLSMQAPSRGATLTGCGPHDVGSAAQTCAGCGCIAGRALSPSRCVARGSHGRTPRARLGAPASARRNGRRAERWRSSAHGNHSEVVGFYTPEYLRSKLEALRAATSRPLIA
jgi:hypothetical protein